jgi:hypothetical protein
MQWSNKNTSTSGETREDTMIFVGHARLPQSFSPLGASATVLVEMEVVPTSGLVVEIATSGFITRAEALLSHILVGRSLQEGLSAAILEFQRRYVGAPQKAICTAVANAYEAYQRYMRQQTSELSQAAGLGYPEDG